MWAEPTKAAIRYNACLPYKKTEKMYRLDFIGYTINRRINSTAPKD